MAPKRLKENPSDVEDDHNVQDAFLRGLEAERFLVKNMRRKVKYVFRHHMTIFVFIKGNIQVVVGQVDRMRSQLSPKVGTSPIRDISQDPPRDLLKDGLSNLPREKGSIQISLLVFKPFTLSRGGTMPKSNSSSSSTSPAVLSPKINFHREMRIQRIQPTKHKEQRAKAY